MAQALVSSYLTADMLPLNFSLIISIIFAYLAIFAWQAIGVLRAGEQHVRDLGSVTNTWGAQLGILIVFLFVLSDVWSAWLMTRPAKDLISFSDQMARERAETYTILLSDDNTTLIFSGDIALGATKSLAAILAANPQVATLSLSSSGGNIFEARGLANLAHDAKLNTQAVGVCSSACTIAFIGGVSRQLAPGARLGFHQYRIDATYDLPFANPKAEQERDQEIFRKNGVKDWFVKQMFQEHSGSIWYPSATELQRAGIVVSN